MSENELVCTLDCPPFLSGLQKDVFCCARCKFLRDKGCMLSRDDMPKMCREYNCKDYSFFFAYRWDGKDWRVESIFEKAKKDMTKEFSEEYSKLIQRKG